MLGNWIDLIIIFYLLIHFADGMKRGFFSILITMFGFVLALALAFFTYSYSAGFFVDNFAIDKAYASVLGFFINIFVFKIIIIFLARRVLPKTLIKINNSLINKTIGGLVSSVYGAIVVFMLFSIVFSFSLPHFIGDEFHSSTSGKFVASDPLKLNNNFEGVFGDVLKTTISKLDFLTIEKEDEEGIDLGFKVPEPADLKFDEKMEVDMLEMLNRERVSRGLGELIINEKARAVARKHGVDMFEEGYFSHTNLEGKSSADRMKDGEVEFTLAGENLALSKDLLSAHNGLMESPGHRENILHPFFHKVGIGVIDGGAYGIIFVQNFTD